jgi:hypothetical protein
MILKKLEKFTLPQTMARFKRAGVGISGEAMTNLQPSNVTTKN